MGRWREIVTLLLCGWGVHDTFYAGSFLRGGQKDLWSSNEREALKVTHIDLASAKLLETDHKNLGDAEYGCICKICLFVVPQKYILSSYIITSSAIYHLQLLTYFLNMQHTVHKFTHVHTAILHICCMYNNAMYRYMQASLCPRALYNCTCIHIQMFQLHFLPICTYLPFALKQAVDVTCICPQPVKRRGKYMFCRLLWIFCKRSKCTKLPMVPYKNKELNIDKDFANLQNMQNHSFSPCTVAYIAKHKASLHYHICSPFY